MLTLQGDALSQAVSPGPSPLSLLLEKPVRKSAGACCLALPPAGCVTLGRIPDSSEPQFPYKMTVTPNLFMRLVCGFCKMCRKGMLCKWSSPESGPSAAWALAGLGWPQIQVESANIRAPSAPNPVPGSRVWGKVPLHGLVSIQSIGLCRCFLSAQSHTSFQLRPPSLFLVSFPL